LRAFYASPGGQVAARLVRDRLAAIWPRLPGQAVLGIGHAAPYLSLWQAEARACIALVPEHGSPVRWPPDGPGRTLLAEGERLPFRDLSFDRILMVHGLEAAENARAMLREAWRVLRDDGRLVVVVPNRVGMWAQVERTPFGHGQPYSAGQLSRVLARHMFRVERLDAALFVPPYGLRLLGLGAEMLERAGRLACPRLGGVAILEAEKDIFAAIPAGAVATRRRVLVPERGAARVGAVNRAFTPAMATGDACSPSQARTSTSGSSSSDCSSTAASRS
jgi:SAM-dependent methyltransferase